MAVTEQEANQTPTLGGLRERHLQLMRRWRSLAEASPAEAARAAEGLRAYAAAAGANISDDEGRDDAQGMIDYWTAALSGLKGARFPEFLQLAKYSGAEAASSARRAQDVFEGYASEEDKRVARALLLMLIVSRGDGYARAAAMPRASLQQHIGSARLDAVVEDFVRTGTISKISAQQPDDDRFEIGDIALIERWPALAAWLEERKTQAADRDAMLKRAEHWARAERPNYLLASSSKDLDVLDRYRGLTDTLDAYIQASKKRQTHGRWWLSAGLLFVVLFIGGAIFLEMMRVEFELEAARNAALILEKERAIKNAAQTRETNDQQVPLDQTPIPAASSDAKSIRPSAAQALEGYMWFGQDGQRQVRTDNPAEASASFAKVKTSTRFRAKTAIYLRVQWPKSADDYTSPKAKGIVPKDALIVLREELKPYARLSGVQYWAHVVYAPQVSLSYTTLRPERLERIEKTLAQAGFEVSAKTDRELARDKIVVRYFRPGLKDSFYNAGPADALLVAARLALNDSPLADRLRCEASAQPTDPDRPQLLELVLDPRTKVFEGPAASCAAARP